MTNTAEQLYVNLLERWLKGAEPYLFECPGRPEFLFYGTGENGWGVQTNLKAVAAYAALASDPRFDEKRAGKSRQEVLDIALRMFRYCLHTHKEGSYACTDGTSWGHTWISVLGMERMMHAVDMLDPYMTEEDRALLRRVMLSESDWLLDHYTIVAGLYAKDGNNKPESNLWNGAFLHRTAVMYPDAPRVEAYREKGSVFLVNALSVPEDAECEEMIDGKKVAERYEGANFFPSFALNHHGYLNIGYKVICLSNMAMLHFFFKRKGVAPPESLYRHGRELWEVVKLCTFPDGRLARIGGDTRVRYTYCQDYVIPVWHMMADLYADKDGLSFEQGWLKQIQAEMDASADGTFLSARCKALQLASPLYFTRLESDRAAALSMGLAWRRLACGDAPGAADEAAAAAAAGAADHLAEAVGRTAVINGPDRGVGKKDAWHDSYHGAYMQRGKRRIASWVWESAEKPQGLCLPPGASDMAEWRENMAGRLEGFGRITDQSLEHHAGQPFPGGFLTWGSTLVHTRELLAEGQQQERIARNQIVCAALPDDMHMIVLQHATALRPRTFFNAVKGLNLLVPNDVLNGNRRMYEYAGGRRTIEGFGSREEVVRIGSRWVHVDGRLGVIAAYGSEGISIHRPGLRQIGLKDGAKTAGLERTLYADAICGPCELGMRSAIEGETVLDTGFVLQSGGTSEESAAYAASDRLLLDIRPASSAIRGVRVQGADGHLYMLLANFSDTERQWVDPRSCEWSDLATGETIRSASGGACIPVHAGGARLLRLETT